MWPLARARQIRLELCGLIHNCIQAGPFTVGPFEIVNASSDVVADRHGQSIVLMDQETRVVTTVDQLGRAQAEGVVNLSAVSLGVDDGGQLPEQRTRPLRGAVGGRSESIDVPPFAFESVTPALQNLST